MQLSGAAVVPPLKRAINGKSSFKNLRNGDCITEENKETKSV